MQIRVDDKPAEYLRSEEDFDGVYFIYRFVGEITEHWMHQHAVPVRVTTENRNDP